MQCAALSADMVAAAPCTQHQPSIAFCGCSAKHAPDSISQYVFKIGKLDVSRKVLMLSSSGFQQLDPRSPFDRMILFCIAAGDLWESDDRLQKILTSIFPE